MNYWNYKIKIQPRDPWVEILVAQLSENNFDSFQELEEGVEAYIAEKNDTSSTREFIDEFASSNNISIKYHRELVPLKNWNSEWENSFDPVIVGGFCTIKAPFHDITASSKYVLNIMPKMSFGTGHHPTTYLMVDAMSQIDFKGKTVLDMGSGTGVLGILAYKLQASEVLGVDVEEWAVENAAENALMNNCDVSFELGGKEKIPDLEFDVVLANINMNILLDQKTYYSKALKKGGTLLLSGFLGQDKTTLVKEFEGQGFEPINANKKENWVCLEFQKK